MRPLDGYVNKERKPLHKIQKPEIQQNKNG